MQSHTITGAGGVRLHVAETGNPAGTPILFITGFSQCWLTWRRQLDSPLASDHRLLALDLRGHGLSDKPRDAYGEAAVWADDLAAVITGLRLASPVLVGWSYAGFIISDYVRCHGDASIGGINFVGAATSISPESATDVLGAEFLELLPGLFATDVETSTAALDRFVGLCTHGTPSWSEHYLTLGYNAWVPPHVRQAMLSRVIESADVLGALRVPVLISHGERDRIVRPDVAQSHAALIPSAQLSVYEDAGHALFLDQPQRFNLELAAFVDAGVKAVAARHPVRIP